MDDNTPEAIEAKVREIEGRMAFIRNVNGLRQVEYRQLEQRMNLMHKEELQRFLEYNHLESEHRILQARMDHQRELMDRQPRLENQRLQLLMDPPSITSEEFWNGLKFSEEREDLRNIRAVLEHNACNPDAPLPKDFSPEQFFHIFTFSYDTAEKWEICRLVAECWSHTPLVGVTWGISEDGTYTVAQIILGISECNDPRIKPRMWSLLNKRVSNHPDEVQQAFDTPFEGRHEDMVFHVVFDADSFRLDPFEAPPHSAVKAIIDAFPQCLSMKNIHGMTPLLRAVIPTPSMMDFFYAVFHGHPSAAMVPDFEGNLPLHHFVMDAGMTDNLLLCWELLREYPLGAAARNNLGKKPLDYCHDNPNLSRYHAITLLLKLAETFERVPEIPSSIEAKELLVKSKHPSFEKVAETIQPYDAEHIVHAALVADCPFILFDLLADMFPDKLHSADDNGIVPLELAMLNLARDGTLEQSQIVYHLLCSKPDYLEEKEAVWRPREDQLGLLE